MPNKSTHGSARTASPPAASAACVVRRIGSQRRIPALGVSKSARAGDAASTSQSAQSPKRIDADDESARTTSDGGIPVGPNTIAEKRTTPHPSGAARRSAALPAVAA